MRTIILGCALAALSAVPPEASSRVAAPPPCCFTNPRFSGVCTVQPAAGETCASVLAYLNDPQSQGKTYCASTSIRGGWKPRKCARVKTTAPDAPAR